MMLVEKRRSKHNFTVSYGAIAVAANSRADEVAFAGTKRIVSRTRKL